MRKIFQVEQKILFRHCDPAGIVFYPRYFEMINDSVEAFFEDVLNMPFVTLHKYGAVPAVAMETTFPNASYQGDLLVISVQPLRLGKTSIKLDTTARCNNETRFTCKSTLVFVDATGAPTPWPTPTNSYLTAYFGDNNDT